MTLRDSYIEVLRGRDHASSRLVWLFDFVQTDCHRQTRIIVSNYYELADAIVAAMELRAQGYRIVWEAQSR